MSPHRVTRIAAISVIALACGSGLSGIAALAADDAPLRLAQATGSRAPGANAPAQIRADDLVGKTVRNPAGDKIGSVDSVLLSGDGRTTALVVSAGGFLGMGEHSVAIPMNRFTFIAGSDSIGLNATKDELKAMPEYRKADDRPGHAAAAAPNRAVAGAPATRPAGTATTAAGTTTAATDTAAPGSVANRNGWRGPLGPNGELRASKLIGTKVTNRQNETIGTIDDVLIGKANQLQAVLSVGGFLGIGEHDVQVEWRQIAIVDTGGSVHAVTDLNKDQLKALPEYKK